MALNRLARLATVIFALASLLFMQLAVAGYACPGEDSKGVQIRITADATMPCAQAMVMTVDDSQPHLCHAHCHATQQSVDTYQAPSVIDVALWPSGFVVAGLFPVFAGVPLQAPHLQRTTAPPLAIRNCCLRL